MPYIATSCCTLKASLCRDRSCCLLNSVCPYTRLVGKGCCLCNPVSHGSCNNFKGCSTPFTRFLSISFASPKRNGRKKRAPLSRRAALVGRIPRTGSAGCCGRPSWVRFQRTFEWLCSLFHILLKYKFTDRKPSPMKGFIFCFANLYFILGEGSFNFVRYAQ